MQDVGYECKICPALNHPNIPTPSLQQNNGHTMKKALPEYKKPQSSEILHKAGMSISTQHHNSINHPPKSSF
jgi:hypothetical protein